MVRVFAVEDDPRALHALSRQLGARTDVELAGGASSGEEALRAIPRAAPDVVLMDLELPGRDGVETTRALKACGAACEVLVLTSFEDEDHVFAAMRAGAAGYLVKGARTDKLVHAILEVDAGGTVIEPRLARRFWEWFKGLQAPPAPEPLLTELEREILFALAKGLSNAEVGRVVSLDRRTVRTHLGHIYGKLGVRSHVEAVVEALKRGLLRVP